MIDYSNFDKIWSKRFSVRLGENWLYSVDQFSKMYGVRFPDQLIIIEDELGRGFVNKKQLERISGKLLNKAKEVSSDRLFEKQGLNLINSFLLHCKGLKTVKLKELNKKELINILKDYAKKEDKWMNFMWLIFILDQPMSEGLESMLEERIEKTKISKYLDTIFTPESRTAVAQHKLDLLKLAIKINNQEYTQEDVYKKISNLNNKYKFFTILNLDEKPLSRKYFEGELKKLLKSTKLVDKYRRIVKREKILKTKYKEIIKEFKSDKKIIRIIETCHKIAFYREYRNDMRQLSYYYSRNLFKEIARRLGTNIEDVIYLTRDEILTSIETEKLQVTLDKIRTRKKNCVLLRTNSKVKYVFDQDKISKIIEKLATKKSISTSVSGLPASKGIIRGKVTVIKNIQQDMSKFKEGDVLIATTTNLAFVPILSKASAIVTDEGGMLCHAAIVSRELDIPCIVGTKNATEIFKDGVFVEVNASIGKIKIIDK